MPLADPGQILKYVIETDSVFAQADAENEVEKSAFLADLFGGNVKKTESSQHKSK